MAATMATMAVTTPVVAGLGGSSLRRRVASPSKVQLTSGLKFSPCLSLLSCITICKGFISIILCSARLTELSCAIYVYSVRERRQKLLFDDPKSAARPPPLHVTRHLVWVNSFNRDWLRKDLSVVGFGLIGWLAPSSIPVINGNSLTGLFLASIGPELAHFPTGPSLTSPFWLWLITWHVGLFIVLTLGQIGFKGRKDGYWES